MRQAFGSDFSGFQKKHVLPILGGRGLLEKVKEKFLVIFSVTRYRHTLNGEAVKWRLEEQMRQAHLIPTLLYSDPAQVVALISNLGSAVLLVDEVKSRYARFSQILREHRSEADSRLMYIMHYSYPEKDESLQTLPEQQQNKPKKETLSCWRSRL